jgi:hypothetical protein
MTSELDSYINFIKNHSKYFKQYNTRNDIPKSSLFGWLYIFKADCYNPDLTILFEQDTIKFGNTVNCINTRLTQYKKKVNPTNIECIQCSIADEREDLVKSFLTYKTNITPIAGREYLTGYNRKLIKLLMLIMVHTTDNQIKMYHRYNKSNNTKELEPFFEKIKLIIEEIDKDENFNLQLDKNIFCKKPIEFSLICETCNTTFSTLSNLNYHKRSAKFCREKRNDTQPIELISCEFCNIELANRKSYLSHLEICKEKKKTDTLKVIDDFKLNMIKEMKDMDQKHILEIKDLEQKHILEIKDIKSKYILEIKDLENEIKTLKLIMSFKDIKYNDLVKSTNEKLSIMLNEF